MNQFIFTRLQAEIESLDSEVISRFSPLLKDFRSKQYSSYLSCISPFKSQDLTPEIHQQCLKSSENSNFPLQSAYSSISDHKSRLYSCLNNLYTRTPMQTLESEAAVDRCLSEFKTAVFRTFEEIKA